MNKINGGYILLAKKIIDSEIWQKPAEYLKIWIYILNKVEFADYNKKLPRGTGYFNFSQEKIPHVTLTQIYEFLRWAKTLNSRDCPTQKTTMITTQKTTRGVYIKVNNYNTYQDIKNYLLQDKNQDENQDENQELPNTIIKRIKEINNSYINISSSSIEREITKEEEEVLKKFSKEIHKVKYFRKWLRTIINNGDLQEVLEKAQKWQESQEKKKERSRKNENIEQEITPEEDAKIREIQARMREEIKKRRRSQQ